MITPKLKSHNLTYIDQILIFINRHIIINSLANLSLKSKDAEIESSRLIIRD